VSRWAPGSSSRNRGTDGAAAAAASGAGAAAASGAGAAATSGAAASTPSRARRTSTPSRTRKRATPDPAVAWARRLARTRPNLVEDVLDRLVVVHGRPVWEPRLDATSELVLTILSQNTADLNSERAFQALRDAYPSEAGPIEVHRVVDPVGGDERPPDGWGGVGMDPGRPPDWQAVESAPLPELVETIRSGGLAEQKAPRIQAALRTIREERGDHRLDFLADLPARDARDWLTRIPGIGPKTASVVLLFCFGAPLMPVDTHVERVSKRIGLIPPNASLELAHEAWLRLVPEDRAYEAHVNLITHGRRICDARRPKCALCPVADRCRFVDRKAP
jgi:endonuclease-3